MWTILKGEMHRLIYRKLYTLGVSERISWALASG